MYDGIQPSPYEVMFLPLSMAEAQHRLVLRTAARYTEWAAPEVRGPQSSIVRTC